MYFFRFADVSDQYRNTLVEIIVSYIPLQHHNLLMIAAATFIVYHTKINGINLDFNPENYAAPSCESPCSSGSPTCIQEANSKLASQNRDNFESYYRYVEPFIISNVGGKNADIVQMKVNFKLTLMRYIIFVQNYLKNVMST